MSGRKSQNASTSRAAVFDEMDMASFSLRLLSLHLYSVVLFRSSLILFCNVNSHKPTSSLTASC